MFETSLAACTKKPGMTAQDMASGTLCQFTAIAINGRAVLLNGPSGCGKTSLALALIDRGAVLIGDDGIALTADGAQLVASPAPATIGLAEIRNVGIVNLPSTSAPVALVLHIDPDAPRYIEKADTEELLNYPIPSLKISLGSQVDPIRVEYALALHGTDF